MPDLTRRHALAAAGSGAGALALGLPSPGFAQAPASGNIGFHRFSLGDLEIIAVHDGAFVRDLPPNFLRNADQALYVAEQTAMGLAPDKLTSSFTCLVVRGGGRTVLIDTGFADNGAPGTGRLGANMLAAGLRPEDVTHVLLTHFHGDHVNGVRRKNGDLAFPKAEIVVPEAEWAFWMDDARMSAAPEAARGGFMAVRRALAPEAGKVRRFGWEQEVLPGITAIRADGHTPGHTAFLISSGKEQLLALADTTNNPHIFARHPGWHAMFDMDGAAAEATRRRLLDRASADKLRIAFYHGAFPSTGYVLRNASGYDFVPAFWM